MFKPGDKVERFKGLNDSGKGMRLGNTYTVRGYDGPSNLILADVDGKWSPSYFRLVEDKVDSKNIIQLNGTKYVKETIPGKGDCLVPYVEPRVLWQDVIGKVVCYDGSSNQRYLVIMDFVLRKIRLVKISHGEHRLMSDAYLPNDDFKKGMVVIAESIADAVKKGLIK